MEVEPGRSEDGGFGNLAPASETLSVSEISELTLLVRRGASKQVISYCESLISKHWRSSFLAECMGISYILDQQPQLAIEHCKRAIALNPTKHTNFHNLAVALVGAQRFSEAIPAFEQTLDLAPTYIDSLNGKAAAHLQLDQLDSAIKTYKKALSQKPDNKESLLGLANALLIQKSFGEAESLLRLGLAAHPDDPDFMINLGVVFDATGEHHKAIYWFRNVVRVDSTNETALVNLSASLLRAELYSEAGAAASAALKLNPKNADAYINLSVALMHSNDLSHARGAIENALVIDPTNPIGLIQRAQLYAIEKNSEAALKALDLCIQTHPDYGAAHLAMSALVNYDESHPHFRQMRRLFALSSMPAEQIPQLGHALGKAYADIDDYGSAYDCFFKANNLRENYYRFDIGKERDLFGAREKAADHLFANQLEAIDSVGQSIPIFIVGMPRSGTSLAHQIVSSHPQVFGAGELSFVAQFGEGLANGTENITSNRLLKFREAYMRGIAQFGSGHKFVVDKMPLNFRFIPLILSAFPEARIIHTSREPCAICWSNFVTYFPAAGLAFSNNLKTVVDYYQLYVSVMQTWERLAPKSIFELNYENLVSDRKLVTQELISFIGLEHHENFMHPERAKTSVATASLGQVQQPVYQDRIAAWKNYEPYLNGAFERITKKPR